MAFWDCLGRNAQLALYERSELPHHEELRARVGETDSGQLGGGQVGSDLRLFAPAELIVDLGGDLAGDEAVGPEAIGLLVKLDVAPATGDDGDPAHHVFGGVAPAIDVGQRQRLPAGLDERVQRGRWDVA